MLLQYALSVVLLLKHALSFDWDLRAGSGISFAEYHEENIPLLLGLDSTNKSDGNLLLPFNTTRIPGSNESLAIQQFIVDHFNETLQANWTIEQDRFEENGRNFTNLVFTLNQGPSPSDDDDDGKYLMLSAHYDTLIRPDGFVGAMDSAASCAMMLYIAQFVDWTLAHPDPDSAATSRETTPLALKLVFFDGEEALEHWSAEDSLYGSRHLAAKWEVDGTLPQIELMVLLDLLGDRTSRVPSYFGSSHKYYSMLSEIETDYLAGTALASSLDATNTAFVALGRSVIDDDHVPFYRRGTAVLHVIPYPFPTTWHAVEDDFAHLSSDEIRRWTTILSEFTWRSVQRDAPLKL
ncbi:hypothetical protein NCAS_0D00560 [Naumovozyma castellii]|uniref:Peptide hydrolase n=1 Tax=Naumovozyma castellii TaxID=27288 RepID=G0VEU2_NAUCA|nr:hypothetical protein NCAS_0D00560 [Naumovozyma castellii CBS 4309]CCC69637.1 hypothetical protein NCAS_0D00560 [Naumovozyma castellii CBS 4309]